MSSADRLPASIVSAGAAVALVGTFLTWVRSGSKARSSYEVFELVDRLGFSEEGTVGWALRLWPLMPLLLVASVVLWWWPLRGRRWLVVRLVVSSVTALYAAAVGHAVTYAPDVALFDIGPGPVVTALGALGIFAGVTVWAISAIRRARSARP